MKAANVARMNRKVKKIHAHRFESTLEGQLKHLQKMYVSLLSSRFLFCITPLS